MEINKRRVSPIKSLGATLFNRSTETLCREAAESIFGDISQIVENKGQCLIALDYGSPMTPLYRHLGVMLRDLGPKALKKVAFCAIGENAETKDGTRFIVETLLGPLVERAMVHQSAVLMPLNNANAVPVFGVTLADYFKDGGIVDLVIARAFREGQLRIPGAFFEAPDAYQEICYREISLSMYNRDKKAQGKATVMNAAAFWHAGKVYLCALESGAQQEAIINDMIVDGTTAYKLFDHSRITVLASGEGSSEWATRPDILDERLHLAVIDYNVGHA